jgi:hypothetical protein
MVGVGAIAGTLSGGYTDAGLAPDQDTSAAPRPAVAAVISRGVISGTSASETPASAAPTSLTLAADTPEDALLNTTTIARTPVAARIAQPHEQMPAAAIAMRFPGDWQDPSTGNSPPQTMAYAAESARQAASGFQLASVNPAAEPQPEPVPLPKRMVRPEKPKPPVLFNDAQLASIKARLRLSRDQEQYWPQVEQALRAISWKMATQPNERGRQPLATIDPSSPEVARLKSAAFPLIMSMREDQKQEVRQLAHTMGLKQVASMF